MCRCVGEGGGGGGKGCKGEGTKGGRLGAGKRINVECFLFTSSKS